MTGHIERASVVSSNAPSGEPSTESTAGAHPVVAPSGDHAALPPTPTRRPRVSTVVLSCLLALVALSAGLGIVWLVTQLDEARSQITDQHQQITDQQRQIEEQRDLIDRKEQFGAAMAGLYETVEPLIGLPYATLVPWAAVEGFADNAWIHRWNAEALSRDVAEVEAFATDLASRAESARSQAAGNASGTPWESTLDSLGRGWVSMAFDDEGTPCGPDALACVSDADPFTVRVNGATRTDATMTDWIRTGIAYHEYAHVLQFTNPEATQTALAAFAGDHETMADCYALTFLDGWSLDHDVPIDEFSYWQVSVGYGYTCDETQRQVIRDWAAGLGIVRQSIGG